VEEYAAGASWRLDGPALDACRFVEWLIGRGVPSGNVSLLVSPLMENEDAVACYGFDVRPADYATVRATLFEGLRDNGSDFLMLYWGGHGVVDGGDTRRLFCADATATDKRNLDLTALLNSLRSSLYSHHPRQAILIDACQNLVEQLHLAYTLPAEVFPLGIPRPSCEQRVLLAASPGEVAVNIDGRKTGLFSEVLRAELATALVGTWPPNLDALRDRIDQRFTELRAIGKTRQAPSYLWYRGAQGEAEVAFSPIPSTARSPVSLAALGELTDVLLSIDEFAHEASRWQVIRLMPREIASTVSSVGTQRLQVIDLLRSCERFASGPAALVDALRTALPDDTRRRKAEEAIGRLWPATIR
jgi:hypothetical protein